MLVDPAGEAPLDALEARLRGVAVDWAALIHDTKRAVADGALLAEVRRIVRELADRRACTDPSARGRGRRAARLLPGLPLLPARWAASTSTRRSAAAREHRPDLAAALDDLAPVLADPTHPAALRFQQTSGMVMAKGVEDCAFYRYSRLTSLNEVGGDPADFSRSTVGRSTRRWPSGSATGPTR